MSHFHSSSSSYTSCVIDNLYCRVPAVLIYPNMALACSSFLEYHFSINYQSCWLVTICFTNSPCQLFQTDSSSLTHVQTQAVRQWVAKCTPPVVGCLSDLGQLIHTYCLEYAVQCQLLSKHAFYLCGLVLVSGCGLGKVSRLASQSVLALFDELFNSICFCSRLHYAYLQALPSSMVGLPMSKNSFKAYSVCPHLLSSAIRYWKHCVIEVYQVPVGSHWNEDAQSPLYHCQHACLRQSSVASH